MSDQADEPGTAADTADSAAAETPDADANEVTLDSEHSDTAKPKGRDAKNRIELTQTKERLGNDATRREIERIAAETLADPQDVWLAGVAVGRLLQRHGDVDPEKSP